MKVEIWSDIACPFCYIGKAHFQKALASFQNIKDVDVVYRCFQLDPDYKHKDGETVITYLTDMKGMSVEHVKQMTTHIEQMAKDAGITINFNTNIPANTLDAHRLILLATQEHKQEAIVEALFEAHFTNGKNIEEKNVLKEIGLSAGLSESQLNTVLDSDAYAYEVKQDILESRNIGVRGVPFFLFNRKYAISGAQPVDTFIAALKQSFEEWRMEQPTIVDLNASAGGVCNDDNCSI